MSTETKGQKTPSDALASLKIDRGDEGTTSKGSRYWVPAVLLVLVACGSWWAYQAIFSSGSGQADWMPEAIQNRTEVRLTSVVIQRGRSADAVVVATGYLESRRQAKIGARAAGRIDIVNFEEGDDVAKGELLAELEHRDLDASLSAAAAAVERAKALVAEQDVAIELALVDKKRIERLRTSRSVAEADFDKARFAYKSAVARKSSLLAEIKLAEAQRQQAEQLRENMYIRAPFAGTVISKDAEVGESILPGGMGGGSGRGSVATIADLEHLEIECDVQEAFISRVREEQEAEIAIDAVQEKKYQGVVRKIIPMGDRARATIKVQVEITDADELLFPEMAGTVFFLPVDQEDEVTDSPRMFCPTTSVDDRDERQEFVWVVDSEKRAQKLAVETGDDRDGKTEVLAGLTGKERLIIKPVDLQPGSPVKVVE